MIPEIYVKFEAGQAAKGEKPREIESVPRLLVSAGLRSDGSRVPTCECADMSREDRGTVQWFPLMRLRHPYIT